MGPGEKQIESRTIPALVWNTSAWVYVPRTFASIDAVAPSVLKLLSTPAFLEPSAAGRATAEFAVLF